MESDYRITYWRKGLQRQNFGDFLSELFVGAFSSGGLLSCRSGKPRDRYESIHLIGSVISAQNIEHDLEHAGIGTKPAIAFWGCGKRDHAPIPADLLQHCDFFGVRGPLTRSALGLPMGTPIGDPALLLPLLYRPKPSPVSSGRTICVPHFLEPLSDEELLKRTGADAVIRPNLPANPAALHEMIDALADARFVLAGALHGAIVACAFGTPFSFFDSGYIDVPFKWEDFSASVNIPCRFATSVPEGIEIYHSEIKTNYRELPAEPILACAPIVPPRVLFRRVRERNEKGMPLCA